MLLPKVSSLEGDTLLLLNISLQEFHLDGRYFPFPWCIAKLHHSNMAIVSLFSCFALLFSIFVIVITSPWFLPDLILLVITQIGEANGASSQPRISRLHTSRHYPPHSSSPYVVFNFSFIFYALGKMLFFKLGVGSNHITSIFNFNFLR